MVIKKNHHGIPLFATAGTPSRLEYAVIILNAPESTHALRNGGKYMVRN